MHFHIPGTSSGIIHCDVTGLSPKCIVAATGFFHPNGIAKGPESSIYVLSTADGKVQQMHSQADHTLIEGDTLAVIPSPIDNMHVDEKGQIIVAAIPRMLEFVSRSKTQQGNCAGPVWRVRNETSEQK